MILEKFIMAIILSFCLVGAGLGTPFMVSDPNDGVTSHQLNFPDAGLTYMTLSQPDGSLRWDIEEFTGSAGWHSGTVQACETYSVEDLTTNIITSVDTCSDPSAAPFRLRVPKHDWQKNFKVQE